MSINVIINGAQGKMGKTTVDTISAETDLNLVATLGRGDDLGDAIRSHNADVVVDFTLPDSVFTNTKTIIENNAHPVIGTTGLKPEEIKELTAICSKQKLGGVIAPNFSLCTLLLMKYAKDAATYLPNAEIIEMHHAQKVDAPSGTSIKTRELMQEADGVKDIPIHSVRLPGHFSHQAVIFGGDGETLTLRVDSMDRRAMMPGVFMACRKVMELDSLIYGLDNLL